MSKTFQCPACGGLIEYTSSNQAMTCPFCGTAVTTPEQAETPAPAQTGQGIMDAAAKTVLQGRSSKFKNSAEIMDEVKRLLREDDKSQAVEVYCREFNVALEDAQSSIEQIEIDMKHSGAETPPTPANVPSPIPSMPISSDNIIDAPPAPQKSSFPIKGVIIGCLVALVLCCLCVISPAIVWMLNSLRH
jgi:predicted  nucleic acid-binding Zn-ribbon protein